jgi:hypothetical protein
VLTLSPLRLGGPTRYSKELYWNPIGGGNNLSDFTCDLYFYIDQPLVAQALEFDLNQTFGGTCWVWGSECHFNGSGKWDIWDDINGWKPTSVACTPFPATTGGSIFVVFEDRSGPTSSCGVPIVLCAHLRRWGNWD